MYVPLLALLVLQTSPFPHSLPERLRGLSVGLLVQHHPNPCFAVREGEGYFWRHDTTVQSLVGELTLVEYGAYLYTDKGWRLRVALKPDLFARVYRCAGARLRRGRVYTDPDNARRDAHPLPGDAIWYFLARDARGTLYKGTALIETEGMRSSLFMQLRGHSQEVLPIKQDDRYIIDSVLCPLSRGFNLTGSHQTEKPCSRLRPFSSAFATVAPVSLTALRQTQWQPLNATPAMGHASSPATQDVSKDTLHYTLTSSVTDLDTWQKNLDITQTSQLAGNEGDVSIIRDFDFTGTINRSFDPASGKREETYIFDGPFKLADSGEVHSVTYTFYGHDNMSLPARHDNDTQTSSCKVYFKYFPKPVGGPVPE